MCVYFSLASTPQTCSAWMDLPGVQLIQLWGSLRHASHHTTARYMHPVMGRNRMPYSFRNITRYFRKPQWQSLNYYRNNSEKDDDDNDDDDADDDDDDDDGDVVCWLLYVSATCW